MRALAMVLILAVAVLTIPTSALGHGGGVDGNGGHNDRKAGTYHFHSGPLAGRSYGSKTAALAALRKRREGSARPTTSARDPAAVIKKASTAKKVDALIALLVKKRLITEAELAAQLKR